MPNTPVKRRELTLEDYIGIFRRRRWWLILSAIAGIAAGYGLARVLPPRYTSHTLVLVEQPVVPDNYVKPVVSDDLAQRLASMQEQILSRTHLQSLLDKFSLYADQHLTLEQRLDHLHKAITVTPLNPTPGTSQELPGFNVDVTLGNARLAQNVCAEITSMFMQQNLRLRQQQAEDTTEFLAKQLGDAKAKLDDQDAKLAAFQTRYIGELPDDDKTNVTLLTGMTPQLDAITQALNQAEQDKAFTESLLEQQLAAWRATQQGHNPDNLDQQLTSLRNELQSLRTRYTDQHPDVIRVKEEIAQLERKMQDSGRDQPQPEEAQDKTRRLEPARIQQLRAQLHQLDVTIHQKTEEQADLQRQIRTIQARIQLSPVVQQQFKSLTRDYQTALNFYNDLLKKRNESQMATDLEHRQEGQQFRVLDPASLPQRPSFPDRRLFSIGGMLGGLMLGLVMIQADYLRDKSMRSKRDVQFYLDAFTLAVIPAYDAAAERKGKIRSAAHMRPRGRLQSLMGMRHV